MNNYVRKLNKYLKLVYSEYVYIFLPFIFVLSDQFRKDLEYV